MPGLDLDAVSRYILETLDGVDLLIASKEGGAPEVILSHAAKAGGAPAVASRFLHRLKAVAGDDLWKQAERRGDIYVRYAEVLDQPAQVAPIAPTIYWPSAPMLKRPPLNPIATARPSRMYGVVCTSVCGKADGPVTAPVHSD